MLFVALTGGIASGKSTISQRLQELGAVTVDADELARLVVSPGWPALTEIERTFGAGVIDTDGSLDRPALAKEVFGHPEKLQQLNGIVHPAIREYVDDLIAKIAREHPEGVLVYEIPLLVESEHDYQFDLVLVAEAPEDMRISRMIEHRGMTEEEAKARLSHQATNEERRAIADILIDTSGTFEETITQTDAAWKRIQQQTVERASSATQSQTQ